MAHLTDDQILDRIAGLAVSPEPDEHLGACPECRARSQRLSTISNQLDQLKNSPLATAPCGPCRPIAVWWRVAAGKSKEPELSEALAHAAECAECSETLKNAIADLNQDDAEEAEGRNRNAIDGDVLAAQLRAGAHPPIPFWRKPVLRYGASAIAAALVLAAAYSLLKGPSPAQTDRLLAQAFTERRTIPMRFPGANDSPLRQERSSKPADTPVALMEAELQIAKASGESDPQWLDLKARAALLHWDYEAAIDSIERAQTLAKKNSTLAPALLGDLAMAFFERGEAENRAADYASAVENFSKAIAISPSNALLRFNRAATYERLFLYTQAADDWKEAVRLEPSGAWADEARSHLKALEEKKRSEVGTLTPRAYLDRRGEGLDPEFALRPATESWLQLIADDNAEATEAFEAMASDLERVHGDPWMKDLSAALKHPLGRQSYGALARAIHANAAGQAQSAEQLAREAGSIFQTLGNRAGLLYAKFEAAYAQQRALRRDDCAEATQDLTRSIPENYRWLLAQSWTERGVCRYPTGDLGGSWHDLETAARYAREGQYREPAFRALSFQNDYRAELGDSLGAWEGNLAGLSDVWSGPHEAISPFHFYSGMTTLATLAGNWNMALAAKREAMNAIAALNNPSLDAVNHYRVASLALSASQDRTAEEEFEVARRLFQSLPADNQTKAYQFAAELGRAQAESDAKNFRDSKDRLTKMSGELESFKDSAMRLRYHDLLGRLDLAEGDRTAADRELAIAHDLAVKSRESLKDARQQSVWMNDQRRLYHTLLDVSATPAGAWTTWREFHGSTSPPSSANAISFAVLPDRIMAWATLGGRWIPAVQPIASADLQALTGEFRRACEEDPNIPLDRIRRHGKAVIRSSPSGLSATEITGRESRSSRMAHWPGSRGKPWSQRTAAGPVSALPS